MIWAIWPQDGQRHPRKRVGVSGRSALRSSACARRSRGPEQEVLRRAFASACRSSARSGFGFARGGRLHLGEQECNAEVGRYPRRRWLFWNATRRLRIRNCPRGTRRLSCRGRGKTRHARTADIAAPVGCNASFGDGRWGPALAILLREGDQSRDLAFAVDLRLR